MKIKISLEI